MFPSILKFDFDLTLGSFWFFGVLMSYFAGRSNFQKLFWGLIIKLKNFYFGSIALSCFFETFPGGGGWLDIAILITKSSAFDFD